jgi:hypothetical protein
VGAQAALHGSFARPAHAARDVCCPTAPGRQGAGAPISADCAVPYGRLHRLREIGMFAARAGLTGGGSFAALRLRLRRLRMTRGWLRIATANEI